MSRMAPIRLLGSGFLTIRPRISGGFERPVRRPGVTLGAGADVLSVRAVPPEPVHHDYIVTHLLTQCRVEAGRRRSRAATVPRSTWVRVWVRTHADHVARIDGVVHESSRLPWSTAYAALDSRLLTREALSASKDLTVSQEVAVVVEECGQHLTLDEFRDG